MKNIFFAVGIIFCMIGNSYSANDIITQTSKINYVTVFLHGAQIERSTNISVNRGMNYFLFDELPQQLDANSIQVKGKGNFTILSVKHQINYLKDQKKSKEIVILEDTLNIIEEKLEYKKNMLVVFQEEENLLIANKSIGGNNQGVKISELKEAVIFFRSRLKNIKIQKLNLQKDIAKLDKRKQKISNQIGNLKTRYSNPTSEILVTVSADIKTTGKLRLSYFVTNAGWTPFYDLRVTNINTPIDLKYKANVFQTTGEDWNEVMLTLSTGNPSLSAQKPHITPWYLNFYSPVVVAYDRVMKSSKMKKSESMPAASYEMAEEMSVMDYTSVNEGTTSIDFVIKIPYTIPSDGKENMVEMQKFNLPAEYEYYCAPKLDKDVFLTANISQWDELNLLSGNVNLFFEETFVGNSFIDTKNISDTLSFSLGRDKNIVVTRIKLKDFTSKQSIGSNKKETRAWKIEVRNKKRQKIAIIIEDQFPVSSNKEIVIEKLDLSGGDYSERTGILRWEFDLNPSENKKINLMYSVKYPKSKTVILD